MVKIIKIVLKIKRQKYLDLGSFLFCKSYKSVGALEIGFFLKVNGKRLHANKIVIILVLVPFGNQKS